MNVLDEVPVALLAPVAPAVSFRGDRMELNSYILNPLRKAAENRQVYRVADAKQVLAVLDVLTKRIGTLAPKPTPQAVEIGRELNAFKLGIGVGGPYENLLGLDWGGGMGPRKLLDRRTFGELRVEIHNGERAFRAFEEYPWPGPKIYFAGAWRQFSFSGFQLMIRSGEAVGREKFQDYITLSLLARFEEIVDRVEALVEKKLRKSQRQAVTRMIALTVLSVGIGAAVTATAAAIAKLAIGQVDKIAQAKTAASLQDLGEEFQEDHPSFAAELVRTVESLKSQGGVYVAAPEEAAPAGAASPVAGQGGGPPSSTATANAVATAAPSLLQRIIDGIRRIFGGGS